MINFDKSSEMHSSVVDDCQDIKWLPWNQSLETQKAEASK